MILVSGADERETVCVAAGVTKQREFFGDSSRVARKAGLRDEPNVSAGKPVGIDIRIGSAEESEAAPSAVPELAGGDLLTRVEEGRDQHVVEASGRKRVLVAAPSCAGEHQPAESAKCEDEAVGRVGSQNAEGGRDSSPEER